MRIGPHVRLGRISGSDADEFVKACMATGAHYNPEPQMPVLYAFIREDAPQGDVIWHWDNDGAIQTAIALSRLVRDNSHGRECAVRTVEGWDSGHRQVAPLDIEARAYAYRVLTGDRGYLDDADARELHTLVNAYYRVRSLLPDRVHHALWLAEFMTRSEYLLIAYIHTVSALEALVNTSTERASTQFVRRTRALATELGIDGMSGQTASRIYELRSRAVHGVRASRGAGQRELTMLLLAQRVLRAAIRRSIEDPTFALHFAGDDSIDAKWPLAPQDQAPS